MRDPCNSGSVKSKRERQSSSEIDEGMETQGQVKMRELRHLMGFEAKTPRPLGDKGVPYQCGDQDMSEVSNELVANNADGSIAMDPKEVTRQLDLNAAPSIGTILGGDSSRDEASAVKKPKKPCEDNNSTSSIVIGLDLNASDVPIQNPFHPHKKLDDPTKSKDVSECASSTTGPLEGKQKDSLRIWKEMKQNGFLSSTSHGGIPVPKQRGRKSKNESLKRRIELTRKEQADEFVKLAAPSGLLNNFNPGIINHVRNRKQVHSIIEALVKSEKPSSGQIGTRQGAHLRSDGKEVRSQKDLGTFGDVGANWQRVLHSERREKNMGPDMVNRTFSKSLDPQNIPFNQHDLLPLRLSASTGKTSEMSMFNEDSTNLSSVTSLSVKGSAAVLKCHVFLFLLHAFSFMLLCQGRTRWHYNFFCQILSRKPFHLKNYIRFSAATIASQWLELLHQDIKGRLAALKRSKRRVHAVISTELPFLISKEFSSDQENNTFRVKNCPPVMITSPADAHRARWSALFDQMDKALSEEEQQLEIWLNQVKEMQMQCENGLQSVVQCNTAYGLHNSGATENLSRPQKADSLERELSVRAAAASIYSTCNFLLSKGDVSCF
ncbi:hypothetical protein SAY86_001926 [Trapa natans]|uniref:Uncharacterized protein n=1 Tax=Trapa natans TaxID=22666 RepID=A0AAN7QZX9_TRANT|nr:hypothetical protein SAY86_001926 [Trapa natans]